MREFTRDKQNRIVCDDAPGDWLAHAIERPSNFSYGGDDKDKMFRTWALGPVIETRDSTLTDKSNAEALRRFLASDTSLEKEYRFTQCSHWAVGWVEHVSFHAYENDKKTPTRIARIIAAWFAYLRDEYPIADDNLYSEMEIDATGEWLSQEGPRAAANMGFILPDEWYGKVTNWWDAHQSSALENNDDTGASPSDDDWRAAFEALKFERDNGEC